MHILEIDRRDEGLTHRLWEIGKAADERGRPWSSYWSWRAARTAFTADDAPLEKILLAAYDDARMVGGAEISLPRLDNTHLAWLEVFVDPEHERRGAGAGLVEAAVGTCRDRGRTTVLVEVSTPVGEESPGIRLARRAGFQTGVVDDMKVADLDETAPSWPRILDETEPAAEAYRLRSWDSRCPDELAGGYCALMAAFNEQTPTGELDLEPEHWDEARLRDKERRFRESGRREVTTVAVAPTGEVVGVTEVMVSEHAPDRAFQGATLVLPGHRGHRLGLRLKATNHLRLKEVFPSARTVLTGNADVNEAMNAVNERLGFRAVEQIHEMQRRLEAS